jgi:hypothetical protein
MEGPINDEIAALRALWAEEESDAKARRDAAQREKLEKRRELLRSGQWKPDCRCDTCLRAVLELTAPAGLCEKAQHGNQWW